MDQKKTLWIIAAVGAFLLFVLGAAFIVYPKAPKVEQTITRNIPEAKPAPLPVDDGWVMNEPVMTPTELSVNDLTVFAENANVYGFDTNTPEATTIDLNALKNAQEVTATALPDVNITVEVKDSEAKDVKTSAPAANTASDYYLAKTESAPAKEEAKTSVSKKNNAAEKTAPAASAKTSSVVKANTSSASTAASAKTNTSAKAASSAKAPATKTQFWVQVAAYSSKKAAEGARSVLDENKITADIFTYKDSKDNLFYRVRVGPYTTKSEAEYWKSKIIKISEFSKAESYITSTSTQL
ncbi:MAG: SPOR domain-containing protein [Treponema sp.]|nr:SPOR domain-containing protein [Treponema sp.]